MRVAWLTDTHFNFVREPDVFWKDLCAKGYDAFIITGDVSESGHLERMFQIWWNADVPVYFVLGNHDFYGSSVDEVRKRVTAVTDSFRGSVIRYLTALGPQKLAPGTALVGDDGWYDGRNGAYSSTDVQLNDFWHIEEFTRCFDRKDRLAVMQRLAGEAGRRLAIKIRETIQDPNVQHLYVATHVAPWAGAAWHQGQVSNRHYQPFFSSYIIGREIEDAVGDWTGQVTVLCGHSHGEGTLQVRPNIVCRTGGAEYYRPAVCDVFDLT